MALLLDIRQPEWMTENALRDLLTPLMPDVPIYCALDGCPREDIRMLAVVGLHPGMVERLPNLSLVQKLGAGVERILGDPALRDDILVARLAPETPANEIAEYCLGYVMRAQRNMMRHDAHAAARRWVPLAPVKNRETTVAVLGLGHIGARTARLFAALGFRTLGWSRTEKSLPDIECHAGRATLDGVLAQADYVASILPSTPETADLFDAARFAAMKPTATLINAGRGDLIVDADLVSALDAGALGAAVLDVFRQEPLPVDHPFWTHDRITVTPHVSGWHIDDGLVAVAENYRRLMSGEPLLHPVDRARGY